LIKYGWQPLGRGIEVPERFVATYTVKNNYTVEMLITVENGQAGFDAIKITRLPGRPRLHCDATRIPCDTWVDHACAQVAEANQGGQITTAAEWRTEEYHADIAKVVKGKRREILTDDFLSKIADIYRANVHGAPIQAIHEKYPAYSISTVKSWIAKARDRGILPRQGKGRRAI
jgi:hypothetical protein